LKNVIIFNPSLQNGIACPYGARACPPEDVGGIPGYFDFRKSIGDFPMNLKELLPQRQQYV
jgi:hypothetical protein